MSKIIDLKKILLVVTNLCNLRSFANICVFMVVLLLHVEIDDHCTKIEGHSNFL